ncbi:hypothetical protein KC717_05595 [Candidatus Dojkabacteria bacterium]|uniref:Uncharacterized protein n=1 Tax=Candidatus Dojkabacteria bacterium TaxID=2099670 RepID=A0A955RKP5_9BACT|nr:hypothetical protein [Candidatus Dojkabacteria bacterium]
MIPKQIQGLIQAHRKNRDRKTFAKSLRHVTVSKVATLAGSTYETVRNSVELEQDHLLRRRAIRRIISRMKALKNGKPVDIAEDLIRELIWAKYTRKDPIPEIYIERVGKSIYKYQVLIARFQNTFHRKPSPTHASDLYDILSFEIERILSPYFIHDSLANIQYSNLVHLNLVRDSKLAEKYTSIQTYINVHKTINKFDSAIIKYYMFSNAFPFWAKPNGQQMDTVVERFEGVLSDINKHLEYKIKNKQYKEFIRQSIPLKILNNTIAGNLDNAEAILDSKQKRDKYILETCSREYSAIRKKIRVTMVKTIVYLFITKMGLAFLIEVPYELWAHGGIDNYVPLLINVLFPPVLMAIIASSFRIPAKRNNEAILQVVDRLMDPARLQYKNDGMARTRKRPFLFFMFKVFSNVLFFIVIGLITFVLREYLRFSYISIAIFVLFLSLISFGALKTRNIATELVIVPIRGSIFTPMIDTIASPILSLGKQLSEGVAKFSPIPAFFDKLLETPFKSFLMVFEEWNSYVREQREEIV